MSNQENKQAKQDLPADPEEQPKPAPKPSPEKRPEKQAPPPKITAPASKKVKNPKRVVAGKALAAANKEKLAKIKAFEVSELVKQDQQTSEATEGNQTESFKQPAERPNSNPDCSSSVLFLVGGVAVVGGLSAFGYQKWTASANQQASRPVKRSNPATQPNATESSKPAKRSEATEDNQEKKILILSKISSNNKRWQIHQT